MKQIIASLSMIIMLLIVSCGGTEQKEMVVNTNTDLDVFKTYELDTTAASIDFADMIEHVEFMRLEETDASLLSYIGAITSVGDTYLLGSGLKGDLYFFSNEGEYLSKINRKGKGPEEYDGVQNKWVRDSVLFIYSSRQKAVKRYSLSGDFISATKVAESATQLTPYKDGYALDMNMTLIDDTLAYNVALLNQDFKREKLLIPFGGGTRDFGVSTPYNGFRKYGDTQVYLRTTSDSLFLLKEEELEPLAKFDFGNSWLWDNENVNAGGTNLMEMMQEGKYIWNMGVKTTKQWYYLNYMKSFLDTKTLMIDRATGEYRILDMSVSHEENYTLNALHWEDDRLLFSISSVNVADLLSELDESQWKFRAGTTLDNIESSENSVIMWVKFKNSFD